ncbi:MAG TPA: ATP-dependent DNA helicase, partial [Clostridiaceae bacterium]|nr:ATP-dependent DNA helicase [Clostridiaceae bacterium]
TVARKYKICPFELGLDLAYWCDIIIGDYNHGFDPRSHLTLFDDPDERQVYLVDEAHNLPERTRTMYSAILQRSTVIQCREALGKLDSKLEKLTAGVLAYFDLMVDALTVDKPGFDRVEKNVSPEQVLLAQDFRSVSSRAPGLCRRLQIFITAVRPLLDQIENFELKRPILNFFFDAQYFIRICDVHWNNDYILMFRKEENTDFTIKQVCMNIARHLNRDPRDKRARARIFFSATLTPLTYYAHSLCGRHPDNQPETLALPSPFPTENMNLMVAPLSTVYRERQQTADPLAELISFVLRRRKVNQLIFFPSYNYLNLIYPRVRKLLENETIDLILQRRSMDDRRRQLFIEKFRSSKNDRRVAGFAVMGSIFSEGIDLTGRDLGGVICVGTGLPQVTPELEILRNYYDSLGENGFMYAYVYPGFNKVMQSAGRLIRTETDTGSILLIDERFAEYDYQLMFPAWWHPHIASDRTELGELLDETHDLPEN